MLFKSRIYTSVYLGILGGGSLAASFRIILKYIEHVDVSFLLFAAGLFLSILLGFVIFYILFPLLKKADEWDKKHESHSVANTILESFFGGVIMATLCLLVDTGTQVKREIWFILIRYAGWAILCVSTLQYRKLGRFLRDKMAKKASFKLWLQYAIVFGLLYIGIGYGLMLAFVMFSNMPFVNIDVFLQVVFEAVQLSIITGLILGNALYIARVLKQRKNKRSAL
jgi:hypothetical protein